MLACRSAERGARLEAALRAEHAARGLPPPSLEVRLLDLASLSSVRSFCEAFKEGRSGGGGGGGSGNGNNNSANGSAPAAARTATATKATTAPRPLHVLICNAGVFNMGVRERRETAEGGFEEHMACNHLGHFLLAVLLMPSLRAGTRDLEERRRQRQAAAGGGKKRRAGEEGNGADNDADSASPLIPRARVVSVSSAMHHYGASLGRTAADRADPMLKGKGGADGGGRGLFSADRAYGRSKLAQLVFARELRRRAGEEVDSIGLHPGMVVTDVVRSLPPAVAALYRALMGRLLLSPDEGARASVHAATAVTAMMGGGGGEGSSWWYLDANARPAEPCPAAECPETAAWLWRWSAEAAGLKEGEDLPAARAV